MKIAGQHGIFPLSQSEYQVLQKAELFAMGGGKPSTYIGQTNKYSSVRSRDLW